MNSRKERPVKQMDTPMAIEILANCKGLATKLLQPGMVYVYEPNPPELVSLKQFGELYDSIGASQFKLLAGEALITPIELLYLLDLLALTRLRGQLG